MRILAIRGCNLASLAGEFEIDLARGPLGEAGVFAIVGNTGAGKSTLLDALCVALFDRTPRLTNHSRVVVGRGADDPAALGAHDARTLLRRGAAAGWAEVDFESGDLRRYRARWSVHRARGRTDGALQDQQISLVALDGAERLGGTKTETLRAISARLGLTFDQFRRSALLAQGEFAAFLRADGRDRSELLERMTGTQIYTRLSITAHVRAALAEQRLRDGRLAAFAIPVLDDDARVVAEAELAVAKDARVAARDRLARAEAAARWLAEAELRVRALARAEADRAVAEAAVAATSGERDELALRRRAELLRAPWDAVVRIERELGAARLEGTAAAAEVAGASERLRAIAGRRGELAKLLVPLREARVVARAVERSSDATDAVARGRSALGEAAWLVARPRLAPEVAVWPELDARFAEHVSATEAIAGLDRELAGKLANRKDLAAVRDTVVAEHRAVLGRLEEAQRRAAATSQRRGLSLDAARRKEDEARAHLLEVERLVAIAAAARQAVTARLELDLQLAELDAAGRADVEQRAQLEASFATDTALRAERARAVDELRRAAGYDHARAELRDDEPCPLCGSPEHPWRDRGSFDGVIREAEARLHELAARVEATTAALATLAARAQQRLREQARLDRHRATVLASAEGTAATWRAQLAALGELVLVEDPSTAGAETLAAEREVDAKSRLDAARLARHQAESAAKAAAEAQAEVQAAQTAATELADRLADLDRRVAELEAAIGRVRGERAGRVARIAELSEHLDAAVGRWALALPAPTTSRPAVADREVATAEDVLRSHAGATSHVAVSMAATVSAATVARPGAGSSFDATVVTHAEGPAKSRRPGARKPRRADPAELPRPVALAEGSGRASRAAESSADGDGPGWSTDGTASSGGSTSGSRDGGAARAASSLAEPRGDDIASRASQSRVDGAALAANMAQLARSRAAMSALAATFTERGTHVAGAEAAVAAALAATDEEVRDVERASVEHAARRDDRARRASELASELASASARLESARADAGIAAADLRRVLAEEPARSEAIADRLAGLERAFETALAVLAERRRLVDEHDARRPLGIDDASIDEDASIAGAASTADASTADASTFGALELGALELGARDGSAERLATLVVARAAALSELETIEAIAAAADDHVARLVAALAADADARARRVQALDVLAGLEADAAVDRLLGEVIGSHDGKLFRSFAQSLTLDGLLAVANGHLDELAPRYQLERVPRHDLELQVIDRDLGSEVRSVQSLSGGESFLVSLALALGLSSMSAHDVRVRTLLIDEGFGTLDPATLDGALSVLDALQATGRQIGVISHVPALVERVGAHVRVVQRGGGRSEVVVG